MTVYTTSFQIVAAGENVAAAHFAARDDALAAQWVFVESIGGVGLRPNHNGGIRSVFFTELPQGWRQISTDKGKLEAVPSRGTKIGKELDRQLRDLPDQPQANELAKAFGWDHGFVVDQERAVVMFPTAMRIKLPQARYFLRLPLQSQDAFVPDEAVLRAIPESELMRAIEDHNRLAKELAA